MASAFTSRALTLTITPDQCLGYFILTWNKGSYRIACQPETDVILGDLLRRLPSVLVGQSDLSKRLLPAELLHAIGISLWRTLLPDTISSEEQNTLAHALRTGTLPLCLVLPSKLTVLPWELLCDPQAPDNTGFLADRRPLVRLRPGDQDLPPVTPPLRILLLISSPPKLKDRLQLDVESERAAVESATRTAREAGLLYLQVEDIVTPRRVQKALLCFKPHLLHYIGHSSYGDESGSTLMWEDDRGGVLPMADTHLADLLRPRGLRAVVLHSCQTASSDSFIGVQSVADTLLASGIPAVLAQQANFTYESSQRASEMFYTALSQGGGMAEATFELRLALAQADRPDWAVPTLQATQAGLCSLLEENAHLSLPDPTLVLPNASVDLPAPTGVFVGRQRELRALRAMLENMPGSGPTLALITGPGGIGKSTLVAQAIRRYAGQYKAVLTLSCAGYQGIDLFLQRLAEFLHRQGLPQLLEKVLPDPKVSVTAKIDAAIGAFNQAGHCLLLVDNLESVQGNNHVITDLDLRYLLQKLLSNLRNGRVLITGCYTVPDLMPQNKFVANVLSLNLHDLNHYEIRQLLARHHIFEQLSATVCDELAREFGGLPYIYDLLGSKAASQDLTDLIHDARGRITQEQRQRAATEWEQVRGQIIEATALESVIQRLPERTQILLGKLSLFRRPFPQQALENGLGVTPNDWQPLIDWALLYWSITEKNYRLHNLTAQYVAKSLNIRELGLTQMQIAEWYLNYATSVSHHLADYLDAHFFFRAANEKERAGEVAINLIPVFQRTGLYQIWHSLCTETIQDFSGQPHRLAGEALRQMGMMAQMQGKHGKAQKIYEEALIIFQSIDDEHGQAITLGELGTNAQERGQYDKAQLFYEEARILLQKLGDGNGCATVLCHLGMIAQKQGEYRKAQERYYEALTTFEHTNNEGGKAIIRYQLGVIAKNQGSYQEALRYFDSCLIIEEKMNDTEGKADTLLELGMLAMKQREYGKAQRWLNQALTLSEQLGAQKKQATIFHHLGMLAQISRDFTSARHFYHDALTIFKRWGDQDASVRVLAQLGRMQQDEGACEEARSMYNEALKIFKELKDQEGQANTLGQLGLLALQQADYEEAMRYAVQAATIHERLRSPQRDTALQTLLRIQIEIGDVAFGILWQQIFPGQPPPDLSSVDRNPYVLKVVMVFILAQTPASERRIIEMHPALLNTETERILVEMITVAARQDQEVYELIKPKKTLLARCRKMGIATAFTELREN